ncbi:MAG: hypothetical protein HYR88_10935 [Verrucomicrobia bacterium]|nr:hypothetical protein [Verrucomicrobiota bacterium]
MITLPDWLRIANVAEIDSPALLIFEKEGERYPVEVFPTSDRDLNRLVGVEEALQNLLSKA